MIIEVDRRERLIPAGKGFRVVFNLRLSRVEQLYFHMGEGEREGGREGAGKEGESV